MVVRSLAEKFTKQTEVSHKCNNSIKTSKEWQGYMKRLAQKEKDLNVLPFSLRGKKLSKILKLLIFYPQR